MEKRNKNALVAAIFGTFGAYFLIDGAVWQLGVGSLIIMVLFVVRGRVS